MGVGVNYGRKDRPGREERRREIKGGKGGRRE